MEEVIFESVSQYVFGALFVAVFLYEIRTSWAREKSLTKHLEKLASSYEKSVDVMGSMQETQKAMKNEIDSKLDKIYEKVVEKK
jgi:hypothetical protein